MFDDHFVDICIGGINCIIISAGVLVILVVFNKEEKRKNASEMYGIHFCFIECFQCFFFFVSSYSINVYLQFTKTNPNLN